MRKLAIATVGNPNCGKTTLFNALTGHRQRVGNFSGVTVDKKVGELELSDGSVDLTDLPGVYNIDPQLDLNAIDEKITCDFLQTQALDLVINVVDGACLERHLYLTLQLKELGVPMVLVINKMDTAKAKLLNINLKALEQALQMPVVLLSATNAKQVAKFKQKLPELVQSAHEYDQLNLNYPEQLQEFCLVWQQQFDYPAAKALRLLEQDPVLLVDLSSDEQLLLNSQLTQLKGQDIDLALADTRYSYIYQTTQAAVSIKGQLKRDHSAMIDKVLLNRWLGLPIFFFAMYCMFLFAINGGALFIDFFDISVGTLAVDGSAQLLNSIGAPHWLIIVLSQGVGVGLQTVATFIPVIACLYLFLALLESSGYLSRAAFVVDKLMQKIGLPGKAFVPMLMGFGCTVPAIMATRVLEQHRERVLTASMSPFMSCGARLPVYALFAAAFFPEQGQNIVFLLYVLGIVAAVATGLLFKNTLLPGSAKENVLELPDYQLPSLFGVLLLTWQKVRGFILGAGKIIVVVVAVLSVLNNISLSGDLVDEGDADSVLSQASKVVTPLFSPMGIEQDNWPATVGIVTGIFAKEAVIGTLNSLYSEPASEDETWTYSARFSDAFMSIPDNWHALNYSDPLGIDIEDGLSLEEAAEANEVATTTLSKLPEYFTSHSAFAYLLFILLYMPCAAAMGALVKELGMAWARLIGVWSTMLAYGSAVTYYQLSQLHLQPFSASVYLSLVAVAIFAWWKYLQRLKVKQHDIAADSATSHC